MSLLADELYNLVGSGRAGTEEDKVSKRERFRIDIRIECNTREEYVEAMRVIPLSHGRDIDCAAAVVDVKVSARGKADVRELRSEGV